MTDWTQHSQLEEQFFRKAKRKWVQQICRQIREHLIHGIVDGRIPPVIVKRISFCMCCYNRVRATALHQT
jgi:hypothetical protein